MRRKICDQKIVTNGISRVVIIAYSDQISFCKDQRYSRSVPVLCATVTCSKTTRSERSPRSISCCIIVDSTIVHATCTVFCSTSAQRGFDILLNVTSSSTSMRGAFRQKKSDAAVKYFVVAESAVAT